MGVIIARVAADIGVAQRRQNAFFDGETGLHVHPERIETLAAEVFLGLRARQVDGAAGGKAAVLDDVVDFTAHP